MPDFSQRLKELRKERKLTQKQLAESLGIATSTIIKYERGEREPNIQNIKRFANYFNVTVDYLLGFDDEFNNLDLTSKRIALFNDEKIFFDNRGQLGFKDSASKKMLGFINEQSQEAYRKSFSTVAVRHRICSLRELPTLSTQEIEDRIEKYEKTLPKDEYNSLIDELFDELEANGYLSMKRDRAIDDE